MTPALPGAPVIGDEQDIRVARGPGNAIDHAGRCNQVGRGNCVSSVGKVAPGDPMDRRIDMRPVCGLD